MMLMSWLGNEGLGHLRECLTQVSLPSDDVSEPGRQFYRFEINGEWVAYGGLEGAGADMLLRSVVVNDALRGRGVGRDVVSQLERCAASQGAKRIHLLTNTAKAFFLQNGYVVCERAEAPVVICQSAQFKYLCPAAASYLQKTLPTACD